MQKKRRRLASEHAWPEGWSTTSSSKVIRTFHRHRETGTPSRSCTRTWPHPDEKTLAPKHSAHATAFPPSLRRTNPSRSLRSCYDGLAQLVYACKLFGVVPMLSEGSAMCRRCRGSERNLRNAAIVSPCS